MEKAINLTHLDNIDKIDISKFDRIYYGAEFCERLIPSSKSFKIVFKKIRRLNKNISLLTPPVTEAGLKKLKLIFPLLEDTDEIIVNDYGVLNMINKEFKNKIHIGRIIGRTLLRNLNTFDNIDLVKEYMTLLGTNISGIEVDFFNANDVTQKNRWITNFSLYRGPFFWSVTRRCAFNKNSKWLDKFCDCNYECLKTKAIIRNTATNNKFYLDGNKILNAEKILKREINYSLFKRITYEYFK